ncbi:MAG: hypothetical protein WDZ88_02595 [Candidatus Paceibacterota bacterium]
MNTIQSLSWDEISFLAKLRLFSKSREQEKEKIRSNNPQIQAEGYTSLSGTYYGITSTAFFQLKASFQSGWLTPAKVTLWGITWLPLGMCCYWRMLPLSNKVVELVGYDGMSADQCDIRQSILRHRGSNTERMECCKAGLSKSPQKAHTRGLLYVGLAEARLSEFLELRYSGEINSPTAEAIKLKAERAVRLALRAAEEAESQEPLQTSRILRRCAFVIEELENGETEEGGFLLHEAERVLEEAGLAAEDKRLIQLYCS